jgi:hypothetical protein
MFLTRYIFYLINNQKVKRNLIKIKGCVLVIMSVMSLINCKGKQGDPGPTGSGLSGSINGIVTLTAANGTQPSDMSGVVIKTSKGDSTTTNSSGAWTLNESSGTYSLTFSKTGYGTTTVNSYNYAGGGTAYLNASALSQAPAYTNSITLDTTNGNSSGTKDLHINVNIAIAGQTGQQQDMEFFVYFSTNNGVSASNYMGMINVVVPASQSSFKGIITGANFESAGIQPGQVVYVTAYPSSASPALGSKYVNEVSGKTIYTALGQASVTQNMTVPH